VVLMLNGTAQHDVADAFGHGCVPRPDRNPIRLRRTGNSRWTADPEAMVAAFDIVLGKAPPGRIQELWSGRWSHVVRLASTRCSGAQQATWMEF
jgi:hypothetical protein